MRNVYNRNVLDVYKRQRRTVFISNIILQYKYRPDSSLLGTDDGAQVGVINIATLY